MKQIENLIGLLTVVGDGESLCDQLDENRICGDLLCDQCPFYSDETFSTLIQELKEVSEGDTQ